MGWHQVNLHLQFSVFSGYGEAGFLSSYLGVQAHGILWPAPGTTTPAIWPVTPPVVSAKVGLEDTFTLPFSCMHRYFYQNGSCLQNYWSPLSDKAILDSFCNKC